jgi:hypothetical protein
MTISLILRLKNEKIILEIGEMAQGEEASQLEICTVACGAPARAD